MCTRPSGEKLTWYVSTRCSYHHAYGILFLGHFVTPITETNTGYVLQKDGISCGLRFNFLQTKLNTADSDGISRGLTDLMSTTQTTVTFALSTPSSVLNASLLYLSFLMMMSSFAWPNTDI